MISPHRHATGSATLPPGNKSEDAKFVYVSDGLYSDLASRAPPISANLAPIGQRRRSTRPGQICWLTQGRVGCRQLRHWRSINGDRSESTALDDYRDAGLPHASNLHRQTALTNV